MGWSNSILIGRLIMTLVSLSNGVIDLTFANAQQSEIDLCERITGYIFNFTKSSYIYRCCSKINIKAPGRNLAD